MIRIVVQRNPSGDIAHFRVEGHSGSAKKGEDIICAAVSVLTQNAVNSVEALLGVEMSHESEDGFLEVDVPSIVDEGLRQKIQLLLSSMTYGLRAQAEIYPHYVRIRETISK